MIEVVIDAAPDDVLHDGMSVLRRLGGRITRYDIEQQTLEARLPRWGRSATIQLRAALVDGGVRLRLEGEDLGWWQRRRLRAELGRLARRPTREGEDQR